MIFDSDVLIWALRGNEKAADIIQRDEGRAISVVSHMELFQGARNKREMTVIRGFLALFEMIPLSEEIGRRSLLFVEQHALKSGIAPLDALIAASAIERREQLCTGNLKHYRHIDGLDIRAFRP